MKVYILGRGNLSGEWQVVGVFASRQAAEETARSVPGFREMNGGWRVVTHESVGPTDWLHIDEHEVQGCEVTVS